MIKIRINRKYELDANCIYAIKQKKWGKIWIYYLNAKKQRKCCKSFMSLQQISCLVNEARLVENLPIILPEIEK